jgi:uncharacterized protein GlcG (DUF336 family)
MTLSSSRLSRPLVAGTGGDFMRGLTLDQAQAIIAVSLAKAREIELQSDRGVGLDDGGNFRAFAREYGASMFRLEIPLGKVWGVVGMGPPVARLASY